MNMSTATNDGTYLSSDDQTTLSKTDTISDRSDTCTEPTEPSINNKTQSAANPVSIENNSALQEMEAITKYQSQNLSPDDTANNAVSSKYPFTRTTFQRQVAVPATSSTFEIVAPLLNIAKSSEPSNPIRVMKPVPKGYQSAWSYPFDVNHKPVVFFVRNAEPIDRIIHKDWAEISFPVKDKYAPTDINMPHKIPKRQHLDDYKYDSPLTEMGHLMSQIIGRGFRLHSVHPKLIFVSPALRCIETANNLLKSGSASTHQTPLMCIEPGLYIPPPPPVAGIQPYRRRAKLPNFMTPKQMKALNYPVNYDYVPSMKLSELEMNLEKEQHSEALTYNRAQKTVCNIVESIRSIVKDMDNAQNPNVLVVAHALTSDAGFRALQGDNKCPNLIHIHKMGLYYPYCSIVAAEYRDKKWTNSTNPIPPLTYLDLSNKVHEEFVYRD